MKNKIVVTYCENHRIASTSAAYEHGSKKWSERDHEHTCTHCDNADQECYLNDVKGLECPTFKDVKYSADENCTGCGCRWHWESADFALAQCNHCGLTFAL
jgi:hypothetical protein